MTDTSPEIVETIRSAIDDVLGSALGTLAGTPEATELYQNLVNRGLIIGRTNQGGASVAVNLTAVATTPEQLAEYLAVAEHADVAIAG